jgi:Amino acid permease
VSPPDGPALQRRLGTFDAVTIGLGSMVGAGIFVALGPAAAAAGSGLLIGLAVAAVVAYCNATSSARLAALYPQSGGTYVYGRERLGEFWGYAAGWSFVVGKTASCAAMALTVGYYVWPDGAHAVAVAAVVALTAVNYAGIQKSAMLTRIIVALVLAMLAAVVVVLLGFGDVDVSRLAFGDDVSVRGVLQAAGLLFFAFAGYARIATLGEEVRDPTRTIPRAIPIALGIALLVYAVVAIAVLSELGSAALASASAPLADAVRAAGFPAIEPPGPGGRRCGRIRLAVGLDTRRFPNHVGDGQVPASAACVGRRASAVQDPASRRRGGWDRRRRRGRGGRCARGDRLLIVRGAAVLRDRQRVGMDAGAGRPATSSTGPQGNSGDWPRWLLVAGVSATRLVGRRRCRSGGNRRRRVLDSPPECINQVLVYLLRGLSLGRDS